MLPIVLLLFSFQTRAATVTADVSEVRPGPISVSVSGDTLAVRWPDETAQTWIAEFSLDPEKPLITRVTLKDRVVMRNARPQYWASTGKRRGRAGFDEFFDFPGNDPEGTRRFEGMFKATGAKARTIGDRLEVFFDGFKMGIFRGGIAYTFYPGSRLIRQDAVASTQEPMTAYLYDAGIKLSAPSAYVRAGKREVVSPVHYYDTTGQIRMAMTDGPDRT